MSKFFTIITLLLTILPASTAVAQSAMSFEGIDVELRLSVDQSNCPGPNCFEPVSESADSLDGLPISLEAAANNVEGFSFTGRANAMASFDDDGLLLELDAHAPGDECCGGEYLFFYSVSTATIGFNLAEDSLVRIRASYTSVRYDPYDLGSANGTNRFTITNLDTQKVMYSNSWGVNEEVWPAGNYILEAESIGDISCNCSSTMSQIIRIEDRPIPDLLVLENMLPSAYLQLAGDDTYAPESVDETLLTTTFDELPASLFGFFQENPKDGFDSWSARARSNATLSPNRFTVTSNTSAESMGWAGNYRNWASYAYLDFMFDLTMASRVDIEYLMNQSEETSWGQASGATTGQFRLLNMDTDEVVLNFNLEIFDVESESLSIELQPGRYLVWCDSTSSGSTDAGSSSHRSFTQVDMLFNPSFNPADFNQDGSVNGADLGSLISNWGNCAGCPEDLNNDGEVNGADLGQFIAAWTG